MIELLIMWIYAAAMTGLSASVPFVAYLIRHAEDEGYLRHRARIPERAT